MSLMQRGVGAALNRMPKIIKPTQHAVINYALAGTFVAAGAVLWGKHRRAALSAFLCGGALAANNMITDYPGGLFRLINYETHGQITAGLAGMAASLPHLMGFSKDREGRFFNLQATLVTAATALTDFRQQPRAARRVRAAA